MAHDSVTASNAPANESFDAGRKTAISRRQFIKRVALASVATVGGATVVGSGKLALDRVRRARELTRREKERRGGAHWFTRAEHAVVVALCGMIIPTDENGPGAVEVGVVERLDQMLALSSQPRSLYARGLLAFDDLAYRQSGRGFADLADNEKFILVQDLEKLFHEANSDGVSVAGKFASKAAAIYRSWPDEAAASLFNVLVEDTMATFYSGQVAWNLLAYDGPPFSRAYIANFGPCEPSESVRSQLRS